MSLASSVAGAVCLTIEPNALVLRAALRQGACDFAVNTLDESLRAMKNEIRKRKPLSVGLEGDPGRMLAEVLERGVAPQLLCGFDSFPEQSATLETWGALRLTTGPAEDPRSVAHALHSGIAQRGWALREFAFTTTAALREFDQFVLSALAPKDELRRRWASAAGRLFPRQRSRVIWTTSDEAAKLNAATGAHDSAG